MANFMIFATIEPMKQPLHPWQLIDSTLAFDHPWMRVRRDTVRLPDGRLIDDYFVWLEGDMVLVVPVTPVAKFVLVRQYKHASGQMMIEFPAGMVDPGESPEQAARRELVEETGYTGPSFSLLAALTNNPTKAVGTVYVYLAENVEQTAQPRFDENEEIQTLLFDRPRLVTGMMTGEVWVAGTIAAAFLALQRLDAAG